LLRPPMGRPNGPATAWSLWCSEFDIFLFRGPIFISHGYCSLCSGLRWGGPTGWRLLGRFGALSLRFFCLRAPFFISHNFASYTTTMRRLNVQTTAWSLWLICAKRRLASGQHHHRIIIILDFLTRQAVLIMPYK